MREPTEQAKSYSIKLMHNIKQQITYAGGSISFADFMQAALYSDQLGYYNNVFGKKFGCNGDFVTAPTIGSLFASCVAHKCLDIFEQSKIAHNILEIGAGDGQLAYQLINYLQGNQYNQHCQLKHYFILETSQLLQARQQHLLNHNLNPKDRKNIFWVDQIPKNFIGIIIANEVLDAMPVHVFTIKDHKIYEKVVAVKDNNFCWVDLEPTNDFCRELLKLPINIDWDNYQSEICLLMPEFIKSLAVNLQRGAILLYDYGYLAQEYYHPGRVNGTLSCYYKHKLNFDPFYWPGLQDITAHVNLSTVIATGIHCGLQVTEYSSLANFLMNNQLVQNFSSLLLDTDQKSKCKLHQELATLISPGEMGEVFKFLHFTK